MALFFISTHNLFQSSTICFILIHLQHLPLLKIYKSEAFILRNKENYIHNISSRYISQYSSVYHIIAFKKLVTLNIAYLIQDRYP